MGKNFFLFLFLIMATSLECRKLKILFIVNQFPSISQRFVLEQIIEWIKRGHIIAIHSFKEGDHIVTQPEIDQYRLAERTTYGKQLPSLKSFDVLAVQFGNCAKTVIEQSKKQEYKGRIVVSFRGYDISKFLQKNPDYYTKLFPDIDLCLPVCKFFKERLISLGCPPEKILVHHSGINLDLFPGKGPASPLKRTFNIITIARLVEKKGIEYVLRAIALLKKRFSHHQIQYFIIGDEAGNSGEKERLEALAFDLGINDTIRFCGWKTHDEVIKYLALMHLLILPSITSKDGDEEGIPNAVKEAMAVGLPVITTERAGSELVVDGKSGFLIPEKNYEALASKIAFFIQNRGQGKKFGHEGRLFVEKFFDIKKTTALLEEALYAFLKM
jgi:colanic acid/amylovoran biosynthesis glycosyltransferase